MEATLLEDANVLAPNAEYKNFTETKEVILKGTKVKGEPKYITGLRKSEPFTYRLFATDDKKLIFLNKVINPKKENPNLKNNYNMEKTEVTLGADGLKGKASSIIHSVVNKNTLIGAAAGALIAYGYCKYKKQPVSAKHIILTALLGAGVAFALNYATPTIIKKPA